MHPSSLKFLLGAAACSVLLSACSSDGVSLSGGTGHGLTTASNGGSSGGDTGGGSDTGGSGTGDTGGGGSDTGGSNSGGSGTGGGSDTGGSGTGGGEQAGLLGDGAVTVTAGGTTVGTPPLLSTTGSKTVDGVVAPVVSATNTLLSTGNAALPLAMVADVANPVTSALPVNATVSNSQLTGNSQEQPIGVGILSTTPATGSLASVNVASGGKTADVSVLGNGVTSLPGGAAVTGAVTSTVTGAVNGTSNVLNSTASLANVSVNNTPLVTGDNPLVGASVGSTNQSQGSLLTVGANSGGKPLTLKLGDKSLLPSSGH